MHDFNLTLNEKRYIETAIMNYHSMVNFKRLEHDQYLSSIEIIFNLIYGTKRAKKILEFLQNDANKPLKEEQMTTNYYNDNFFKIHQNTKEIQELFTK